jgi:hypothetical protein
MSTQRVLITTAKLAMFSGTSPQRSKQYCPTAEGSEELVCAACFKIGFMDPRRVTPSELKNFTFCYQAWILEQNGLESALMIEQKPGPCASADASHSKSG